MFSKQEVESQSYGRLFQLYPAKPELVPVGSLRSRMGKLAIVIDGYKDDPRSLWEISETRSFMKRLCEIWPSWLYFHLLHSNSMSPFIFSRLNSLSVHIDSQNQRSVTYVSSKELLPILTGDLQHMTALCRRTGVSKAAINQRIAAFNAQLKNGLRP
jgi:hypothetical protein